MMTDQELDALIDAGAACLGLEVRPEWRQAVRLHLGISLGHVQTVMDEPVSDHLDPAPVFRA